MKVKAPSDVTVNIAPFQLCFALKTAQPRVSLYYELDYEDANFRWQRQGFWRGQSQEETPE